MNYFSDFLSLIFPRICASCGNSLWKNEECICRLCEYHLPKTCFHLFPENPVTLLFTGRAPVGRGDAFLYFNKGNKVQRLIHQLKYKGRKDIGVFLGNLYGQSLKEVGYFTAADMVIPVPLHKKKYMQRGYNQSEQIALGLSDALKIPMERHLLSRSKATETQTRKSRFSRYQNVKEIFRVESPEKWEGAHLLLVDDVITTGATVESCVHALQVIPGVRVTVVCLATAVL
jgi:ComF family protein